MFGHDNANSGYKATVSTPLGSYAKPRFETKAEEQAFLSFIKTETDRVFGLNLPQNTGKSKDQIKNEVWDRHYPRWSL